MLHPLRRQIEQLEPMIFCIKDTGEIEELQPYLNKTDTYNLCNGEAMVNLQTWAMREMNVPPYPEIRVYKKIEKNWPDNHPGSTTLFVYFYPTGQKKVRKLENK